MTPKNPKNAVLARPYLAWLCAAGALVAVLLLHLLPAFMAAMVVYSLVAFLVPRLKISAFSDERRRALAVALVAMLVITGLVGLGLAISAFFKNSNESVPALFARMAEIIEQSRNQFPDWVLASLPDDAQSLQQAAAEWLRSHARAVQTLSADALRGFVHMVIGMVVGGMLALQRVAEPRLLPPLTASIAALALRAVTAFRSVVVAQAWISAINTAMTAIYLMLLLPALGIHLPLTKTLVGLTFVAGLMPILGNLISNTIIFVVSLSKGLPLAMASLGYLVVIHKLEYFLNAKIIGGHIRASAWEMLLAMLAMEAAFGVPGLIVAPMAYAFFKDEFRDQGLV